VLHLLPAALYTPGVFRVTCNMTEVRQLLRRCDEGQHNCLAECDDNHMVAGLLLEVLRELPTSLFDFEDFLALPRTSPGFSTASTSHVMCPSVASVGGLASVGDLCSRWRPLWSQSLAILRTLGGS